MVAIDVAKDRVEQLEGNPRQVFGGRHAVKHDGLVAGQAGEKLDDRRVVAIDQKGVIPNRHDMTHGDCLDLGKVHHHAVVWLAGGLDDLAGEGDFQRIAVPVQMAALALVVGNAMTGVEFETACDLHGMGDNPGEVFPDAVYPSHFPPLAPQPPMPRLTVKDHSRDSAGMTYVYPVVSRRAGGVSLGINLNPNNACNWRCIYCQVPDLKRGGPPPIDLDRLEDELRDMLAQIYVGDFLERHAPPEARKLVDIAFSGNGEPTTAPEFAEAVERVGRCIDAQVLDEPSKLSGEPPQLRLITNGSMLGRASVRRGIAMMGARAGEVWFKVDAGDPATMRQINGVTLQPATVLRRLRQAGELCTTWVQTCLFAVDGKPPEAAAVVAYLDLLLQAKGSIAGVHLYGLARPSMQPEAPRLSSLPGEWLEDLAGRIKGKTGLAVRVSP